MGMLISPDLSDEILRCRVQEVLRRHWVRPHAAEPFDLGALTRPRSPDQQVEQLARTALDTMLTRQYRVGPLPSPEMYEQFLAPIRRFVRNGKRTSIEWMFFYRQRCSVRHFLKTKVSR